MVDSLHGDECCIFSISLLIQTHHLLSVVCLRWVQGIQFLAVSAQLFDGSSTECVAGSHKNTQIVFNQPETDLQ